MVRYRYLSEDGRYFDNVIDMLGEAGFEGDSMIAIAQDVSSNGEIMKISKLNFARK